MATCRRTGSNESIDSYNSGGGADYSTLNTWEAATDNDNVTGTVSPVLECEAGAHNDWTTFNGATNNGTYFRIIRAEAGAGHKGIPKSDGSCVEFHDSAGISISETYSQVQDLVMKLTANSAAAEDVIGLTADNTYAIGCIVYDSTNSGAGDARAYKITTANPCYCINCMALDTDATHFTVYSTHLIAYNCTSSGTCGAGVSLYIGSGDTGTATNCVWGNGVNNSSGTYNDTTNIESDATYVNSGGDDLHLAYNDTSAKGQGTDLSGDGTFAFDDDINNGVAGSTAGQTRGTNSNSWDIGFDQYMLNHKMNGVGTPYKFNGQHVEQIRTIGKVGN